MTIPCKTLLWGRVEKEADNVSSSFDAHSYKTKYSDGVISLTRINYPQPLNTKWHIRKEPFNISPNSDFILNLHSDDPPTYLSWLVTFPADIGGTLSVEMKLDQV